MYLEAKETTHALPNNFPTLYCLGCGHVIAMRCCARCGRVSVDPIWDKCDDVIRKHTKPAQFIKVKEPIW